MAKIILLFIVFLFPFSQITAQKSDDNDTDESLIDKIQKLIDVRRSFTIPAQTKKPALLSAKKNNDEPVTYSIDVAITYKRFKHKKSGIVPSVQFDYSSNPKDRQEEITFGLDYYYRIYKYSGGSGKIQPFLTFGRDFYAQIDELSLNVSFIPSFPKFFIPVRDISDYQFKYDGKDNRWVFGFNPNLGITFLRSYGGKKRFSNTNYFSLLAAGITVKRYYFQLDLFGQFEKEFIEEDFIQYNYEATMIFYFDSKERSSLNARFMQRQTQNQWNRNITIGFGLML